MGKKGQFLSQGNTSEIYEWETGKILKLYREGLPDRLCLEEFSITKSVYELLKSLPNRLKRSALTAEPARYMNRFRGKPW